jgi:hypothetical protein
MLLCKVRHFCSEHPSGYESNGDLSYYTYEDYRLRQTHSQLIVETAYEQENSRTLSERICDREHYDERHLLDDTQAMEVMSRAKPRIKPVYTGSATDMVEYLAQDAIAGDTYFRRAAREILHKHLTKYLKSPFTYEARELLIGRMLPRVPSSGSRSRCECSQTD